MQGGQFIGRFLGIGLHRDLPLLRIMAVLTLMLALLHPLNLLLMPACRLGWAIVPRERRHRRIGAFGRQRHRAQGKLRVQTGIQGLGIGAVETDRGARQILHM
ncbi:hypothetical protein, partial [Xanthomonas vasicola]|uniref:hypothetical protein n=1 Tax=Xanthomonas vasicola TaxID=56459 RepID=UPI001647B417